MDPTRRQCLKGGGLALVGAGLLSRVDQVAAAQKAPSTLTDRLRQHTIVVGVESGYRMSRVPHSKQWCWITL